MRQTSLVLVQRSYAISFTFIGGSEDEVNELIERLSFASRKPVADHLAQPYEPLNCHPERSGKFASRTFRAVEGPL